MGDFVFGRVSVAVVTPFENFTDDSLQKLDKVGLENVVSHIAFHLATVRNTYSLIGGIIASGSTGEQHTMSYEERAELFELAVKFADRHEVPVAAGISATTIQGVIQLTQSALQAGCKGIMLGLPPYHRICDEEIREYVMTVKNLVPEPFPILLYNNVMRNGYGPSLQLLAELCRNGTIWGIKHAVAPQDFMNQALELLKLEPSARLYTGSDKLSGEILNFEKLKTQVAVSPVIPMFYGVTSIIGNIYPEDIAIMVATLTNSPIRADSSTSRLEDTTSAATSAVAGEQIHARIVPVIDAILMDISLPAGLKYAMRVKGLQAGFPRKPIGYLSDAKAAEIEASLKKFDESK